MILASIPSPSRGVWHLGPLPIRAYALCIIAGVIVAVIMGERRWQARGGRKGTVADVAALAVPFGLVGGRLYHVITSPQAYFGKGGDPVAALYIWRGGLGIPGAVLLGALGAWIACRRRHIGLPAFGDAIAPGIAVAQAIGRWGNYFNQELFGRPTTLPWGLRIDPGHEGYQPGHPTYHPTFLYESLWDLGVAGAVIWADRRFRLGRGRAFALYIALYSVGRLWIEALRADPANHLLGLRINEWTSLLALVGSVLWIVTHRGPREEAVQPAVAGADVDADVGSGGE
ncbi:MAG: prolipoprotein diacylglyceryl transferase [Actinomycetota bacterium]|nr:prolipoprotein diacylglyceryl transferase [Actinomycetota bacterium]